MRWIMLYNIALLAAICFLCWVLQSGWPCLLIVATAAGGSRSCNCDDDDDDDNDGDVKTITPTPHGNNSHGAVANGT